MRLGIFRGVILQTTAPSFLASIQTHTISSPVNGVVRANTGGNYTNPFIRNLFGIAITTSNTYITSAVNYNPFSSNGIQGIKVYDKTSIVNPTLSYVLSSSSNYMLVNNNITHHFTGFSGTGNALWNVSLQSSNTSGGAVHDVSTLGSNVGIFMFAGNFTAQFMNIILPDGTLNSVTNPVTNTVNTAQGYILGLSASNGSLQNALRTNAQRIRLSSVSDGRLLVGLSTNVNANSIWYGLNSITTVSPTTYNVASGLNVYLFYLNANGTPNTTTIARIYGGNFNINSLKVAADNNLYVGFTGATTGTTVVVANANSTTSTMTCPTGTNSFIMKFDANLVYQWGVCVRCFTSTAQGTMQNVVVDVTTENELVAAYQANAYHSFRVTNLAVGGPAELFIDYSTDSFVTNFLTIRLSTADGSVKSHATIGSSNVTASATTTIVQSICAISSNQYAVSFMPSYTTTFSTSAAFKLENSFGSNIDQPYYGYSNMIALHNDARGEHPFIVTFNSNMSIVWTTNIVHKSGVLQLGQTYNSIIYDSSNNKILYGGAYGSYFNGGLTYRDANTGSLKDFYTTYRYNYIDAVFAYVNENGTF